MAAARKIIAQPEGRLAEYEAKRDFSLTKEPQGAGTPKTGNRFVVQQHWARRTHFDFRLEMEGVLKSWAVTRGPSANPSDKRLAVQTEDHPVDYADFEGTIPQGEYGGGTVMLWDEGVWQSHDPDPIGSLNRGLMKFGLAGQRMRGDWTLVRMKPRGNKAETRVNWLLIKERDEFVEADDSLATRFDVSVRSQRSRSSIEAGKGGAPAAKLPDFIPPSLCRLQDATPEGDGWLHEIKYDGYRMQVAMSGGRAIVRSREGHDWTGKFSAIAAAVSALPVQSAIIDGEAVVLNAQGVSDFPALVAALEDGKGAPALMAFDLLMLNGRDLLGQPVEQRKEALAALLGGGQNGALRFAEHITGDGKTVFEQAVAAGAEGIVSKRAGSRYTCGRGHDWIKAKSVGRDDFVIVGYLPSQRGRAFAALMLAQVDGKKLRYAGRVGTGFSTAQQVHILQQLKPLSANGAPRSIEGGSKAPKGAVWVEPAVRAEIGFAGWTADRQLRHSRFLAIRESASGIHPPQRSQAPVKSFAPAARLTHPDRILIADAGITKRRLAEYFIAIAPRLLPHLLRRPVSFLRAPDGIDHPTFFQRHALPGMTKGIVPVKDGKPGKDYVELSGVEGLMTAAQFSVLELHGWPATTPDLGHPDRMIFDLDPDESVPFDEVRRAAMEIQGILDAAGLKSWPLLSGGKGIHVIAPLDRTNGWSEVERFTQGLARTLARLSPEKYVDVATKSKRAGRIFIDYLRNKLSATAIVPYSVRARATASIAMPVKWTDLQNISAANVMHFKDATDLTADPWQGFFECKQSISATAVAFVGKDQE